MNKHAINTGNLNEKNMSGIYHFTYIKINISRQFVTSVKIGYMYKTIILNIYINPKMYRNYCILHLAI